MLGKLLCWLGVHDKVEYTQYADHDGGGRPGHFVWYRSTYCQRETWRPQLQCQEVPHA